MSVVLKAGGNFVVYAGKAQSAGNAFASIMSYLTGAVYYWNNVTGLYEQVITTSLMVPYGVYWIEVTGDCTWTYGAEETAPTSVQLYSRGAGNVVPYLGSAQPVQDAFASIVAYLTIYYYFNNTTQAWEFTPTMVPLGVYFVGVSQACVWSFAAPTLAGELVSALVWWEGKEGWSPIGETNDWPAETAISTAWTVKNTGSQTAFFKVKFMDLTSGGVQLSPGETGTFYLYPTTPSPGTHNYTLSIIAGDQVVKTYSIQVTTKSVPPFSEFSVSSFNKV